ncbi:MAG: hypothetical protein WBA57_15580 [Elainellaceae cyanobacterium]
MDEARVAAMSAAMLAAMAAAMAAAMLSFQKLYCLVVQKTFFSYFQSNALLLKLLYPL